MADGDAIRKKRETTIQKAAKVLMMAALGVFVWAGLSPRAAQESEKYGDAGELTVSRTIFNLSKRLPSMWAMRAKARAAAIVLILKDQPAGEVTQYGPYDGIMKPLPGLYVGKFEGDRLRELARAGAGSWSWTMKTPSGRF